MKNKVLQNALFIVLICMFKFSQTSDIITERKLEPDKPLTYKMPEKYEYSTQENWIHTKINHGLTNYTTGNMETEQDFSLLPQITVLNSNHPSDVSNLILQDLEKEKKSLKLLENIIITQNHLTKFRSIYLMNDDDFDIFDKDLPGYIFIAKQRSSFYSILGKIVLYLTITTILIYQKTIGYFDQIESDIMYKSIDQAVADNTKIKKYKKPYKIRSKCFIITIIASLLQILTGSIAFIICGQSNKQAFKEVSTRVLKKSMRLVDILKSITPHIKNLNKQRVGIPRGLHENEVFSVKDYSNEQLRSSKLHRKKALRLKTQLKSNYMQKPSRAFFLLISFLVLTGAAWFFSRKKFTNYNLVQFFISVGYLSYTIFLMGDLIADEYLFKDICSYFVVNSKNYESSPEKQIQDKILNQISLMEYIHCFDDKFQNLLKQQAINMSVGQQALFKAAILDMKAVDSLKFNKYIKKIPRNIREFISMKKNLESIKDDLYYACKYRRIIEKLQDYKESISKISECKIFNKTLEKARENLCDSGIKKGLIMFWALISITLGAFILTVVLLRNELAVKYLNDKKNLVPTNIDCRYDVASTKRFLKKFSGKIS